MVTNYYDVNRAIDKPNIVNAMREGLVFGQNQREFKRQQEDRNALRELAPRIIDGDPAAYAEGAEIDPNATKQYDDAGRSQINKLRGFVRFVDEARASGNPQRVNAALQSGAPFLSKLLGGKPAPTQWTPDMDAGWDQLKAKVAMYDQPADPRQGKVVGNNLVDPVTGQVIYQGPEVPVNAQIVEVADGNGGKVQMMFDPRTRQLSDLPVQGQPQGQPMPQGQPQMAPPTGPLLPESVERAIMKVEEKDGPLPAQVRAQLAASMMAGGEFNVPNPAATMQGGQPAPQPGPMPPQPQPMPRPGYTPPKRDGAPAGFRWNADGSALERIPGGPADKPDGGQVQTLSAEEVAQLGLPAGTVAQRSPDGKVTVVQRSESGTGPKPLTPDQAMKASLLENAARAAAEWQSLVMNPDGSYNDVAARSPEAMGILRRAIGNKLRAESGAAISLQEIENETNRYMGGTVSGLLQSDRTASGKAQSLTDDLRTMLEAFGPQGQEAFERATQAKATAVPQPAIRVLSIRPANSK